MADGAGAGAAAGAGSGAAAGAALGPWGALAGGVIGAVGGAMGASKNAKAAGKATDAQREAAMADLAFRQQQYNRYLGLMGPIEDKLAEEAKSTEPLDYGRNAAQIKRSYADALRNISTSAGMRGIAGGGLDRGAMRGAAFQQAGDLSGAYSKGLTDRRNLGLTLTGRGQIGQAAQGVQGGMQNLSNFYGGQAGLYNQAASQGWQNFGQGLQGLAQMYGQYGTGGAQPYSITGVPGQGPNFGNNFGQPVSTVPVNTQPLGPDPYL